jgi:hypothetical protein
MIGLVKMSERRLGHSQPHDQYPPATSCIYTAVRRGPTTMDRLVPPGREVKRERKQELSLILLGTRWGQSNS